MSPQRTALERCCERPHPDCPHAGTHRRAATAQSPHGMDSTVRRSPRGSPRRFCSPVAHISPLCYGNARSLGLRSHCGRTAGALCSVSIITMPRLASCSIPVHALRAQVHPSFRSCAESSTVRSHGTPISRSLCGRALAASDERRHHRDPAVVRGKLVLGSLAVLLRHVGVVHVPGAIRGRIHIRLRSRLRNVKV